MFVVIQKIQLKRPNKSGAYKEYKVDTITFSISGVSKTSYSYYPNYDAGRFERPHREAYKISIHQSYRESGKVKKIQCVIGTIGYYTFSESWGLSDYVESGLDRAAKMFGSPDGLYELVEAKIAPLRKQIQREYHKSEEYKAVKERKKVQKEYQESKADFAKEYHVDEMEYDYCFDVFGHVMNQVYLDQIIQQAKAYSSYSNYSGSNYGNGNSSGGQDYSSYFKIKPDTYTAEEMPILKSFYKKLAMEFHPDKNPGENTTKEMQLLNRLKESWDV
jgi:hypothetical protein